MPDLPYSDFRGLIRRVRPLKHTSYRERDHAFGQAMLTLRTAIGLTQTALADYLGVSRRAVGEWEGGAKYPKAEHLKQFIVLAARHKAFHAGRELEEVRALWKAARQKVLLDETWLSDLVVIPARNQSGDARIPTVQEEIERKTQYQQTRYQQASNKPSSRGFPATLPFQPTPFIGRQAELTTIASLLTDPACRLLTLFGPGGVGKTRLALEVAAQQANAFADGVAFVALASVSSPNQIAHAIGDVLDLDFSGPTSPGDLLLDHLRDRNMLLVLDNFEHLLDSSALVNDILQQARFVTILVTSRARLELRAEWLFEVEGLSYPPDATVPTSQNLAEYSAVQLFVQRAAQVRSRVPIPDVALATVARICEHVAGMPLAIELAAASAPSMSLADIEREIYANLGALETSLRDVPVRHRSMRAAFDHSWNLLTASEQVLFSRLAVFRGGCSLEAAEQVVGAELTELTALVNKSLLRKIAADPDTGVEVRFAFLEPLREYALEKLGERQEVELLQRAYATYFLELAQSVEAQWDRPIADAAIQQLDREYDNIRAVLHWATKGGDLAIGFWLSGALRKFWQRRGYYSEGRAWLEDLLAVDDEIADTAALAARLRGIDTAAWLASDQHDYARARQLFERDAALRQRLGETEGWSQMLSHAAREARAVGQYQQATSLFEDALARHRVLGDRGSASSGGLGNSLYELALVLREQGDFGRAAELFEECRQLHRELGDREGIAQGLMGLGDIARDQGDAAGARRYTEQSLGLARDLGMQWAIGFSLNNLALVHYWEGDLPGALTLINESEALFRSLHADGSRAEVLISKGQILAAQGDTDAAREALTEAVRLAWVLGPRLMVAAALEGLACSMTEPRLAAQAVRLLGAASALRAAMGTPVRPVDMPTVERALASGRSILAPNAFADTWSQAKERPLEEIINNIPGAASVPAVTHDTKLPAREHVTPPPADQAREAAKAIQETSKKSAPTCVQRLDWEDAFAVPTFYGREWELRQLSEWVVQERCRVVGVLGLGGIGKSALSISLMHRAADHFEVVIWRSLRDAPTCEALLDDCLQIFASQPKSEPSSSFEQRLNLFLEYLRRQRTLVVLDNLESLLEEGDETGRMRPGYEDFERLLRRVAETQHQSCLLFTSREKPANLAGLEGGQSPVRVLRLARLESKPSEQLLAERGVSGTDADRAQLIDLYAGNPLALKIVSQTIADLFEGDIAPFLAQGEIIFGGIRSLLDQQFTRLSATEQSVLLWLAILREPSRLDELLEVMVNPVPRARLMEAIEALYRRALIERGPQRGTFTLQSVVLEYATTQLIAEIADEIQVEQPRWLLEYDLEVAQAHEYVRLTQERLLLAPILMYLKSRSLSTAKVEQKLLALIARLAKQPTEDQGYGPANLLALIRLLRGNLSGLDLADLALRSVYMRGVEMQDTNLARATIRDGVFTESFDIMTAVAIDRTGKYWAAASRQGEIRVWQTGGRLILHAWLGHADTAWTLDFSPDGKMLASGSWDTTLKVWEVSTGTLLWTGRHSSQINRVEFSRDGNVIASAGNDAVVQLWDVHTGTVLETLQHPVPVSVLTWSTDDQVLATGDVEGRIRLWTTVKVQSATYAMRLLEHTNHVDGLAFAPDGRTLASGDWDGTVKLWDVSSGLLLRTLAGHTDRVARVAWSPDGRTLASSSKDHRILLWDVEQSSYRVTLQGHTAGVYGLTFTPDSARLLSSSRDGTLRVWDVMNGKCLQTIYGCAAPIYDIDWSPDSTQLVSGGTDTSVGIWDVASGTTLRVLPVHGEAVCAVGWSSQGRWLASSEPEHSIQLWDLERGRNSQFLQDPDNSGNYFYNVAWSPDGQRIASGTNRYNVLIWNVAGEAQNVVDRRFPARLPHVAWSPDGQYLAGGGDDDTVYVWEASGESPPRRLAGHHGLITSVVWSPDGTKLASAASGHDEADLFIWDVWQGEPLYKLVGHSGLILAIAWGLDSNTLISGGTEGLLYWWNVQSEESLWLCEAHQGAVQSLRRSPDGTRLASCGDDGAIKLWDLHSGQHLQTLRRDRPYERLDITGIHGLTEAQKANLRALGAIEHVNSGQG